ncbi:cellulose synthase operon protein YhjQ/BcsQ [uncultured Paludibaculum sp.]|uniref:cellulose synthase operon protein YhjQ/BcsQ n=1 Tax=uncultured Paludibaculum sp. TaxID=1765020 RepID=UPI002AABEFDC|nr:cellulose synthase operon protein YhjQ/BcsQ [uncultured Paludibaculum sp.]
MDANLLRVVLISPHAGLASELRARLSEEGGFEVVSALGSFPGTERLNLILSHFQPDCIYVQCDDPQSTVDLLCQLQDLDYPGPVVACALNHQPEPVIDLLRSGAFDYLHAPFKDFSFHEVALRIRIRRTGKSYSVPDRRARVLGFTSSKPGSGATTLAMQTAFALRRMSGGRVLSIDLNVLSGTSSGWTEGMIRPFDVRDAAEALPDGTGCFSEVMQFSGISLLPAPAVPEADGIPEDRMRALVEAARERYDWVVLDLPCAAASETLAVANLLDDVVVVTTPELASLNTLRRTNLLLNEAGVQQSAIHFVLNRTSGSDSLSVESIEQALNVRVAHTLPNDYFSLEAAGQLGLTGESPLALAVRRMASSLLGLPCTTGCRAGTPAGSLSFASAL